VSDWAWEYNPDAEHVVGGLPPHVVAEVEGIAAELAVVASLTYADGLDFQGTGPGLRDVSRPHLIVWYGTYPRLETILVVRVNHIG